MTSGGGGAPPYAPAVVDRHRIREAATARRGGASGRTAGIEAALAEERAYSLTRAGERLEDAIDTWQLLQDVGFASDEQVATALTEIRDAAWALLVQRECVGFRADNLGWIRRHYAIPREALNRI